VNRLQQSARAISHIFGTHIGPFLPAPREGSRSTGFPFVDGGVAPILISHHA
jgi:hypothetical protein